MFLTLVLSSFLAYAQAADADTMKSVHVVFRNGDSEIDNPIFYRPAIDVPHELNPQAPGDLTKDGKMRAYKLGQYLRSRYSDFLGEEYHREHLYARSTYLERSRSSLLLALAGLYPPTSSQRWHPTLDWQPISIESPPEGIKDPLMWSINCAEYLKEKKIVEKSTAFNNSMASFTDFMVQISNATDLGVSEGELTDFYNRLTVSMDEDIVIPNLNNNLLITPAIARNAAILQYHAQNYNDKLIRLNGGMILRQIIDDINSMLSGETMPKISLYSGQEFNVVGMLWALNAWKAIVPYYSSAVIIELHEKNSEHYIKVLYHDGSTGETSFRAVEGCSEMCPYKEFLKLREAVLPIDHTECYSEYDINQMKNCSKDKNETIFRNRDTRAFLFIL